MGVTEDIADELALEALRLEKATGDETVANRVADILGASSQTTQEAFLTAMRVRRAEVRARDFLSSKAQELAGTADMSGADDADADADPGADPGADA